ncbi:MAG: hypothetical protein MUP15_09570 [Dehalococcoidia bacterium]|nr:hypothetical protein [Dehalococcoidia bacterium]
MNAPGVGLDLKVVGGTGTTIGQSIRVGASGGEIELVQRTVDQAIRQDIDRAIQLLENLAGEIGSGSVDKGKIKHIIDALGKTILTPALQAAVFALVQVTVGKV